MVIFIIASPVVLVKQCFPNDVWREGTGADVIVGGDSPSDIDDLLAAGSTEPIDDLLQSYREGCEISYSSATTITVGDGEVMVSNAAGTIRATLVNASNTSVTFSNIDTGSEANATYYVYAYCSDPTSDVDFDVVVSLSSSTPSGITYFFKLGSFYNNSSLNILNDETITNDNDYYALQFGDWISKSSDTSYLASTDGAIYAIGAPNASENINVDIRTDSSNPPTTARQQISVAHSGSGTNMAYDSIDCDVKKGDYYKIVTTTGTATCYWLPSQ